jgi:acyl-CoA synthetase (AMP-forming)/AMP-acid ligase II
MGVTGSERRLIAGRSIRWDADRAERAYADGWWTKETIVDALARIVATTPNQPLIADGVVRLDAAALYSQAAALARTLMSRHAPGSVVTFMLPNWHEAAVIYVASTMAGMVAHPLLPSLRDQDLSFILKDADSRIIFVPARFRDFDYGEMMSRLITRLETPPEVVILRGDAGPHLAYRDMFEDGDVSGLPALDPDAVRMVMYTSGTTGRPKGVMHSHNSIHALIRQIGIHWRVEPGDIFFVPSPVSHIGGSIYAFECPLLLGARAVLLEKWDPDAAVAIIEAEGCTHMAGASPFLEQLLAAAQRAGTRLPSLKVLICGGAAVSPSLIRAAAEHFSSTAVTRVYGSTEVPVTTVGAPDRRDLDHAADTDGRIGIAEVCLRDSSGAIADEGEVSARGLQMFIGYHHVEDEIDAFDQNGFYRMGDLARRVDGDYLVVTGRARDVIIRNGENISPKEVEDYLVDHPDIAEIAIIGLPDPKTGERACAVIVAVRQPGPDVASLRQFLEARGVAKFKMPEQVEIWDVLPKNDAGKVLKQKIRAVLLERIAKKPKPTPRMAG